MNTLQSASLQEEIHSWNELKSIISELTDRNAVYPREIEGLHGAMHGFFIAEYLAAVHAHTAQSVQYAGGGIYRNDIAVIVPTEKEAGALALDIRSAFASVSRGAGTAETDCAAEIFQLPWWGMVPYRPAAKGAAVFGERASVLAKLACSERRFTSDAKPRVFIIPQRAAQIPVPPPDYTRSLLFGIAPGQKFDPTEIAERLSKQGYIRVPRVTVRGEFTLRGEVLDIFMPGEEFAHRIVFDFDRVSRIKSFDAATQSSLRTLDSLLIYSMKEVVWTDELVHDLERRLSERKDFEDLMPQLRDGLLADLLVQRECEGEELFYPLAFAESCSVLDYLSADTPVFFLDYDRQNNSQENFDREYIGLYRKARSVMPVPPPQDILLPFGDFSRRHDKRLLFRSIAAADPENHRFCVECDPPRSFFGNINYLKESIEEAEAGGWHIYVYAESENQALRIGELLKNYTETGDFFKTSGKKTGARFSVIPRGISAGFSVPALKVLVIQENEIFGRRKHIPRSVKHAKSAVIDTFIELNPGDYVVHVNYGIGLFKGIERVKAAGNERDYIKLEYAGEETVFIPIEQVNLVQRYIGNEGDSPRLDTLGSKSWENRKNRVKKSVEDIAQKLIDLYSRRKAARGFPFPKDNEMVTAFDAAFPYTETDDQLTAAAEIKADMEKTEPMDRLVCGDVGYGKTELAMRAAFKAVMGGKQVAFLAPTTILAEQHYESCLERFEKFPVKIAHLSRFVQKSEQKKILEETARGNIDILIGTHRIIQKDVRFKDLGLLIIDEEQRFGVKDKERLKEVKANIDCLALSATPIPRTLHMSLLKIRDMSILATPPQNRQAIETVIEPYSDSRIVSAVRQEAERGGQVFYLHNRVESLDEVRIKLEALLPEMMIDTAHGQMSSAELDDIFRRFKMGGFHVLVATSIIENGIDIPNVNTIIIDRADMYGVSQLYQLRGRVGRSDRKAYAYLLYPEGKALSEVAMKRLQVISDFTELGAGFKIAMKDMEIRGAGNLLGKDQSGDVYSVGFDLYLKLLEEAVQRLSGSDNGEIADALLELEYTGYIPDTYISNPQTKMEIYKKVAAVSDRDELERVYAEMEDRFGPVPDEAASLLAIAEIRVICRQLRIASLRERSGAVQIEFSDVSLVPADKALRLIRESVGRVKLDPHRPNILILATGKIGLKEKSEFIREKLEQLTS
ncbi:MAG: transcription-repair coupling factor [Bacteroides sp.]|nr:transcription-repair coupling factor [Prevotella sp.]MCM1407273.1 transcription-repair coupling factor [Treponema brennaborense]MCM1469761.1 transcription-repair coupling factor [Bacteroides sp.]